MNQAPPRAQQLRVPDLRKMPHLGHTALIAIVVGCVVMIVVIGCAVVVVMVVVVVVVVMNDVGCAGVDE